MTLERGGLEIDRQVRRTGIRSVRISQDPHPVAGRYCIVEVNGRPIFCKGGNWVPPDLIPSRVTRERLAALVDLACEANFNFLRIWGGGVYAGHDLLICATKPASWSRTTCRSPAASTPATTLPSWPKYVGR